MITSEETLAALRDRSHYGIDELLQIMQVLRSENGCPWDKEQSHASIRQDLIEECYEAIEAIDADSVPMMREELGDVLLQVVFHCQIEAEQSHFVTGVFQCGQDDGLLLVSEQTAFSGVGVKSEHGDPRALDSEVAPQRSVKPGEPVDDQFGRQHFVYGGQWDMMVSVVRKYGVVPMSAMPETAQSQSTRGFSQFTNMHLRKDAIELRKLIAEGKDPSARKEEMLSAYFKAL